MNVGSSQPCGLDRLQSRAVNKPSIVVVLGNRPQFVKHAALQRALGEHSDALRVVVVDTGQHYDYSLAGIFMDELNIQAPDYSLGVGSASHAEQLARILPPLEELLIREKPRAVVVYGDTNSTLGGALAASKLNIPVAHVEAGLRSFDRTMPEEINRIMVDHISELLFCPTQAAVDNLTAEGVVHGVWLVGDVMADIAYLLTPAAEERWPELRDRFNLVDGEFGVVTVHRASNTEPLALAEIIDALTAADMPLIFPLHPRTQHAFEKAGLHVALSEIPGLSILPPLGYLHLAAVVRHSRLVLTDSGGLQKEAFVHGVPCVTLRDTSEWVETVEAGMNILVHRDPRRVQTAIAEFAGGLPEDVPSLYGEGDAAHKIAKVLVEHTAFSDALAR